MSMLGSFEFRGQALCLSEPSEPYQCFDRVGVDAQDRWLEHAEIINNGQGPQ